MSYGVHPLQRLISEEGNDFFEDTVNHSGEWSALVVNTVCGFTTLTDNGVKPTAGFEGASSEIAAGTIITANGKFTAVRLSSGSVVMIR